MTPDDTDGDGLSTCDGDCDDDDATLNLDDVDGDGFSSCDGDCDDSVNGVSPVGLRIVQMASTTTATV